MVLKKLPNRVNKEERNAHGTEISSLLKVEERKAPKYGNRCLYKMEGLPLWHNRTVYQ